MKFLDTEEGKEYRQVIKPYSVTPPTLSSMSYQHPSFGVNEGTKAMKEVFALVDKYKFSGNMFAISQSYGIYITIDIMFRNMLMAMGVVFICTLILIAHFVTSALSVFSSTVLCSK